MICKSITQREAHHLNHASYFPKQRFDPQNGITLCRKCHVPFHVDFIGSFRKKCTKEDFENFKSLINKMKEQICSKEQ